MASGPTVPSGRLQAAASAPAPPSPPGVDVGASTVEPADSNRSPGQRSRPKFLHLFSGPDNRADGITAYLKKVGWDGVDVDICNADAADLSSDDLWVSLFERIRAGEFDFVWMGTPCTTFSKARFRKPGPRPLRSMSHLYGLPRRELNDREATQVAEGNFFAIKSAEMANLCMEHSVGWAIENPRPDPAFPSLFWLAEFQALAASAGVRHVEFDQCMYDAETSKPTRVLFWGVDFSGIRASCNHPKQWWEYRDFSNKQRSIFSAHPPLAGRTRDDGEPATRQSAAYPAKLNLEIVKRIISRGRRELPPQTSEV